MFVLVAVTGDQRCLPGQQREYKKKVALASLGASRFSPTVKKPFPITQSRKTFFENINMKSAKRQSHAYINIGHRGKDIPMSQVHE